MFYMDKEGNPDNMWYNDNIVMVDLCQPRYRHLMGKVYKSTSHLVPPFYEGQKCILPTEFT